MKCSYRHLEWLKEKDKTTISNVDEDYLHALVLGGRMVKPLWKTEDSFL